MTQAPASIRPESSANSIAAVDQTGDSELVARAQTVDRRAFDALALRYRDRVKRAVRRYVRDHGDTEDVVQETLLRAWHGIGDFNGTCAFYTWLHRIAVNTALNYLAECRRQPPTVSDEEVDETCAASELASGLTVGERSIAATEITGAVNRAVDAVPGIFRAAMILRDIEGMRYDDIARIVDAPANTVRTRIMRGRRATDAALAASGTL